MKIKAQVLLFSILLMYIVAVVTTGLVHLWAPTLMASVTQRCNLASFYLAQAGIERAKAMIINDVNSRNGIIDSGCLCWPGPNLTDWSSGLDIAGDSVSFRYNFSVDSLSNSQITITARGQVLDSSANICAHREIQVTISGIVDQINNSTGVSPPDGIDDNRSDNDLVNWSWHEI